MKASHVAVPCSVIVVLLLLLAEPKVSMGALTCSPIQLAPCANAIISASTPSKLCCTRISQQKRCLCKYIRDPRLKNMVNSPNAKKVAKTCGVPYPRC